MRWMMAETPALQLAQNVAQQYAALEAVIAVTLAGSVAAGVNDTISDIDLYVYARSELALADRRAIAEMATTRADVDNQFWEPGDEWIDRVTGIKVDVTFRHPQWIEDQLDLLLVQQQGT